MRSILINIFFAVSLLSQAQNKTIDSLKMALKNAKHDTTKVFAMIMLGENIYSNQIDSAYILWINAKTITESNLSTLEKSKEGKKSKVYRKFRIYLAAIFNNIGFVNQLRGKSNDAIKSYIISLSLKEEIGDKKEIAISLNNLGNIFQNQGEIVKALSYYEKSMLIQEEIKDFNSLSYTLLNMASIYESQGQINKSIQFYERCLKIFERNGDKHGLAFTLNNFGYLYYQQNEFQKSLEYIERSLKLSNEIGDKVGVIQSSNNIGSIHEDSGDRNLALKYYKKSLSISREIGDKNNEAVSLNNIGFIYEIMGQLDTALYYYSMSLKNYQETGEKRGTAYILNQIGGIYLMENKLIEGYEMCRKGLDLSKELGYPDIIKVSAFLLKDICKKQHKFKEALEMYQLEIQMRDSINNEENKKASIKSQLKYEYEKKSAADSVKAAEEKKVVDAQLKQEKTQRLALYGGLGLVGIFALFMVNRFRVTNKQKKLIEEQKKVVEAQKHLVEEKQKEIIDSITYARRIQRALITNEYYIQKSLINLINND